MDVKSLFNVAIPNTGFFWKAVIINQSFKVTHRQVDLEIVSFSTSFLVITDSVLDMQMHLLAYI